jgi:hypothetical protein
LALQGVGTGGCISRHIWNMENLVCTHALPLPVRHGVAAPIRRGVYTHTPFPVVYTIHVCHVCLREGATHVVPYRERVCSYAQHVPLPVKHGTYGVHVRFVSHREGCLYSAPAARRAHCARGGGACPSPTVRCNVDDDISQGCVCGHVN